MKIRRRRSRRPQITCQHAVVGLLMDYLDDNLSQEDRARFERHLTECDPCAEHMKQVQLVVSVTGQLREEDLDPLAREELIGLYRRWRGDQDA